MSEHNYHCGPNSHIDEISIWKRGVEDFGYGEIIFGDGVHVFKNVRIVVTDKGESPSGGVKIGDGTYINYGVFLSGEGKLEIGKQVLVGPYAVFSTCGHIIYGDDSIYRAGLKIDPITVEDDCWIGAGATIIGPTHLKTGTVVAAGSVVKGFAPAYSILAGVPARIVGFRGPRKLSIFWKFFFKLGFKIKLKNA